MRYHNRAIYLFCKITEFWREKYDLSGLQWSSWCVATKKTESNGQQWGLWQEWWHKQASSKSPTYLWFFMIVSREPIEPVVLCHVICIKLTGSKGKTHGKHAAKQQRGWTISWVYQALSGLTTSRCLGHCVCGHFLRPVWFGYAELSMIGWSDWVLDMLCC